MGMNKSHNLAYIVTWDYIGTVLYTATPEQEYALEEMLPFAEAVSLYDCRSNGALQWGPNKIPPARIAEQSGNIHREFVGLVVTHPIAFAKLRLKRLLNLLTLQKLPELDGPYEAPIYSDWGTGGLVDINYEPVVPGLRDWLVKLYYHEGHHWLFKPTFVILMAVASVLLLKYLRLPIRLEAWMVLVAVLYYLTFALVTPKVSYRFFFPSYLVLMTISYVAMAKLCLLALRSRLASEKS